MTPDISGIEHGEYKPGIEYTKVGSKFLLDQNPDTYTSYAKAAKAGHKVQWVLTKKPVAGEKLGYTDKVVIDGKEMTKDEAHKLIMQEIK